MFGCAPNKQFMAEHPAPIVIIGEALIDRFPDGDVIGGAPFNVARNLALLGGTPILITRIGTDTWGATIAAEFERFDMDTRGLQHDPVHPTGTVAVHMQGTSHRFEISLGAAWDHLDRTAAMRVMREAAPSLSYFGTLAQREPASRDAIRGALAASAAPAFLDLNLRDGPDNRALADASLCIARSVKVNDDELAQLIAWFGPTSAPCPAWGTAAHREAIDGLLRHFELQRLTITRGAEGWACCDETEGWLEGSVPPVRLRDTVGAGDAFAAVLLIGDQRGWSLRTTLERAGIHASAVCSLAGAVDPVSAIYAAAISDWGDGT